MPAFGSTVALATVTVLVEVAAIGDLYRFAAPAAPLAGPPGSLSQLFTG